VAYAIIVQRGTPHAASRACRPAARLASTRLLCSHWT